MEQQAMKDVPHTRQEYRQQKGRIPAVAIWLVIGLAIAGGLFFLPAVQAVVHH